jgi:hypothetical protein
MNGYAVGSGLLADDCGGYDARLDGLSCFADRRDVVDINV